MKTLKTIFEWIGVIAYAYGLGIVGVLLLSVLVFGW